MGESLQQERESPWALTLTERVPEAFEIPPSDWPEKNFSGQSAKRNSQATLMSSYARLFSSSIAVVAWPCLALKVPLGRKFIGLFRPNSVAEYRVLFIFLQKTEQQTFHPNIF